jgi:hypothetical protein
MNQLYATRPLRYLNTISKAASPQPCISQRRVSPYGRRARPPRAKYRYLVPARCVRTSPREVPLFLN